MNLKDDENILDIGCGDGGVDYFLKNNCKSLCGFDFSESKLQKAMIRNSECKYWINSFLDDYNNNFDKAFSFSVM